VLAEIIFFAVIFCNTTVMMKAVNSTMMMAAISRCCPVIEMRSFVDIGFY